jgi:membrane protease YdiL (CAAX protease family)
MTNNTNNPLFTAGFLSFFRFIGFVLGGLFVGQFIGLLLALLLSPLGLMEFVEALGNPVAHPQLRIPLLIMQAFTALFTFFLGPLLYLRVEGKYSMADLSPAKPFMPSAGLIVAFGVVAFMFVNSLLITWNMNMQFPEFMSGFEEWARAKEDELGVLTNFLLQTETSFELALVFLVVAILPALGEELLFRGVVQNIFQGWIRNHHVAIWLAAFLFSAIHLQFYGFLPRMVLGALFGYIYWYSGNLWYPIVAHFVNNGFTILAVAMYREGLTGIDIEAVENVPLPLVGLGAILFAGFSYLFIRITKPHRSPKYGKLAESVLFHNGTSG